MSPDLFYEEEQYYPEEQSPAVATNNFLEDKQVEYIEDEFQEE